MRFAFNYRWKCANLNFSNVYLFLVQWAKKITMHVSKYGVGRAWCNFSYEDPIIRLLYAKDPGLLLLGGSPRLL